MAEPAKPTCEANALCFPSSQLWPIITSSGAKEATKSLWKFLMVTGTRQSTGDDTRVLLVILGAGPNGTVSVLCECPQKVLHAQLPALRPDLTALANDLKLAAIIAQMATMNDQARLEMADHTAQRNKPDEPTSVREKFNNHVTDKLLLLTEQSLDKEVPTIGHNLATRK